MTTGETLAVLEARAQVGSAQDVDNLMATLVETRSFAWIKMIDYALGLVTAEEGKSRIQHYLENGSDMQRNYAALYFKRLGMQNVLEEAVQSGFIDHEQAYSR